MRTTVNIYFNPFDTASLHLRSISPRPNHSGFALIHEPHSVVWNGAYYAVLQRNAHTAHAFIRKAIADLNKPNPPQP